ncbi:hypothetical protein [Stenotrophomonas sp. 364]|uniref:phage tail terminator protein n=1 Tax=Stenotrophomonas sp. 364 TaxID=2691571 RepID=UPI0013197EB3|nr:hypothetical protein [Stenotrophomonas sp. 364]QHB72925.1 hypothetical protein GQ674_17230 [Stenotrophomonas sp. 364]
MSVGPFPLSPVITRLQQRAQVLELVGDAAGLADALAAQPAVDAAAYVTATEQSRHLFYSGAAPLQHCDVELLVVIFVRVRPASVEGPTARQRMDADLIPAVRLALLGWAPEDTQEPLTLLSAREASQSGQWLVSHQTFASSYRMTPPPA